MSEKDYDPEGLSEEEIGILEGGDGGEPVDEPHEGGEPEPQEIDLSDQGDEPKQEPTQNPAETAPQGYVPTRALQEAREESKRIKEQLAQYQTWTQEIAGKLADQRSQSQQQEKPEDQPPQWEDDPVARMQWENEQLRTQLETINGTLQTREQQEQARAQEQAQIQQIIGTADNTFNQAVTTNPDIQDAFQFAQQSVQAELQKRGFAGPALKQQMDQHLIHYAAQAPQDPAEFAEFVRRNARYWGWSGAQAPQANQQRQGSQATDKIERMAKAVETNRGLHGGSGSGEPTLEDLAKLTGAELEKLAGENPELFAKFGA